MARKPVREPLPPSLLKQLKQYSGRLATEAVHSMSEQLPYFDDLEANQKASVQLVVQAAVNNFVEWLQDPQGSVEYTVQAFAVVPQDLARRISLAQTVEMVRVAMEFFETWLPLLARDDHQLRVLTESVLRYGREIGFAAAAMYAAAAESRGAWDTRLESLLVDAIVRGDSGSPLVSRAAALSWDSAAMATAVIGYPPPDPVSVPLAIHETATRHHRQALSVVQGQYLVSIVSGPLRTDEPFMAELLTHFSSGPVVVGHTAPSLAEAHASAVEALSGMDAVAGWPRAPRPVHARELLPERALLGDKDAAAILTSQVVAPLHRGGDTLAQTLSAYLDSGGSIEACARDLYVHANTVRYRLKKIAEATGREPTNPRDAYVLRVGQTLGRLSVSQPHNATPVTGTPPVSL